MNQVQQAIKYYALAALLAAGTFTASGTYANPADSFGFGAKRLGMAQSGSAVVNDWTSAYYNMAGLTSPYNVHTLKAKPKKTTLSIRDHDQANPEDALLGPAKKKTDSPGFSQVGMSYLHQIPAMTIEQSGAGAAARDGAEIATNNLSYGLLYTGVVFDLRSIVNSPGNAPMALGLSLALPADGTVAAVEDVSGKAYNYVRLGNQVNRFALNLGISGQPWKDRLSVGFGGSFLAGGNAAMELSDVDLDPSGKTQSPESNVKMRLSGTAAPVAGIQYRQPVPGFKNHTAFIGTSWRGEQYMELESIDATAQTTLLNVDLNMELAVLDFYTPHIFTLSLGYEWQNIVLITADADYQTWSQFRISEARQKYDRSSLNFQDIITARIGGEVKTGYFIKALRYFDVRGRSGISYIPALTPGQTGSYNYLDNDKIMFSLGGGMMLPANPLLKIPTEINIGFAMQLWMSRDDVKNSRASSALNPDIAYGGAVYIVSLDFAWRF